MRKMIKEIEAWINSTINSILTNKIANHALALSFCFNTLALFLTRYIGELSANICDVPQAMVEANPVQRNIFGITIIGLMMFQVFKWVMLYLWVHSPWMIGDREEEKTFVFLFFLLTTTMTDAIHDLGIVLGRLASAGLL